MTRSLRDFEVADLDYSVDVAFKRRVASEP